MYIFALLVLCLLAITAMATENHYASRSDVQFPLPLPNNSFIHTLPVNYTNFPAPEMHALFNLYNKTMGLTWQWTNISNAWNFSNPLANPCLDGWEGVGCACSYNMTVDTINGFDPVLRYDRFNHSIYYNGSFGIFEYFVGNSSCPYQNLDSAMKEEVKITPIGKQKGKYNSTVTAVVLPQHHLRGRLPISSEFFDLLPNLLILDLSLNFIQGPLTENTFPLSSISSQTQKPHQLQSLAMVGTSFDSTLPYTIGNFPGLVSLVLQKASLDGRLPDTLGALTQLQQLNLIRNNFTGTFPIQTCNLTHLQVLQLVHSNFSGELPDCIYSSWDKLKIFDIEDNYFSGRISPAVAAWSNLEFFLIGANRFTGNIPSAIGQMSKLIYISLAYNKFTGSMESWIPPDNAPLEVLGFGDNHFSGLMFDRCWPKLSFLFGFTNELSGTFPSSILGECGHDMVIFDMSENELTGSLPANFMVNATRLLVLIMSDNQLTGSLRNEVFENTPHLLGLLMYSNLLTGAFPSSISNCPNLFSLIMFDNLFSGLFPSSSVHAIPKLSFFSINGNLLSGKIADAFNFNVQKLAYINIGGNFFSGTLPSPPTIVSASRLKAFTASSNCFHGPIPEDLCNAVGIQALALEGVNTATKCRKILVPGVLGDFDAFTTTTLMTGTIPACLFQLSFLNILSLSGNGLHGSIADVRNVSQWAPLTSLSLSHNELTGTIPQSLFALSSLKTINLSNNKLRGTLFELAQVADSNRLRNVSLTMQRNRLSGHIPNVFDHLEKINILRGNAFSCPYSHRGLPVNDPESPHCRCGSDQTNIAFYVWIGLFLVTMIVVGWTSTNWFSHQRALKKKFQPTAHQRETVVIKTNTEVETVTIREWLTFLQKRFEKMRQDRTLLATFSLQGWINQYGNHSLKQIFNNGLSKNRNLPDKSNSSQLQKEVANLQEVDDMIQSYSFFLQKVRRFADVVICYAILCLMPVFAYLSSTYSTHTYSYVWAVAAIWFSSATAGGILCGFFVLLRILIMWYLYSRIYPVLNSIWIDLQKHKHGVTSPEKLNQDKGKTDELQEEISSSSIEVNIEKQSTLSKWFVCWQHFRRYVRIGLVWSGFYLLNFILILTINAVYVVNYMDSTGLQLFVIQVLLSSFQSLWSEVIMIQLFVAYKEKIVIPLFYHGNVEVNNLKTHQVLDGNDQIGLTILGIVIKVVIPAIVTLAISSSCLNPLFEATKPVSFDVEYCYNFQVFDIPCFNALASNSDGTSYTPPVFYYYQCSSAFLRYYGPVFIFTFVAAIGASMLKMVMGEYYEMCIVQEISVRNDQQHTSNRDERVSNAFESRPTEEHMNPLQQRDTLRDSELNHVHDHSASNHRVLPRPPFQPVLHQLYLEGKVTTELIENITKRNIFFWFVRQILPLTNYAHLPEHFGPTGLVTKRDFLLAPHRLMIKLNVCFALFFVFGVTFPPLGVVIYIGIIGLTTKEEIIMKRLLVRGYQVNGNVDFMLPLCRHAIPVSLMSWKPILMLNLSMMMLMEVFIVFDTIGTADGYFPAMVGSIVFVVVLMGMVIVMYFVVEHFYFVPKRDEQKNEIPNSGSFDTTAKVTNMTVLSSTTSATWRGIM